MALTAIHPGEHLAEELKELKMRAAELARQLGVPTNRVTKILNGRRAITGDTALRLAHFFGTTAEFWLNLQSLYELRVAQKKAGKSIRRLPTLKQHRGWHITAPDEVTEAMNRACAEAGETKDPFVSSAARRTLERSEW